MKNNDMMEPKEKDWENEDITVNFRGGIGDIHKKTKRNCFLRIRGY